MKLRKFLLSLFLIVQFFSLNRSMFLHFYGEEIMYMFTYSSYGSIVLLPLLLLLYSRKKGYLANFSKTGGYLFSVVTLIFMGNSLLGLVIGNEIDYWINDVSTYVTFICFVLLGTEKSFWEEIFGPGCLILFVSLLVNIYTTTVIVVPNMDLSDFADAKERIVRSFLSYQTQKSLGFWSFFLLMAPSAKRSQYLMIILSAIFMFVLQILFQKRSPAFRVFMFFLTYWMFIPFLLKNKSLYRVGNDKKFSLALVFAVVLIAISSVIPVNLVVNQLSGLIDRYSGKVGIEVGGAKEIKYEKGFWGIFTVENERLRELFIMNSDMNAVEKFIGKAAGGVYEDKSKFYQSDLNSKIRGYYKDSTHIGWGTVYMKGGLLLLAIYFFFILYGLVGFRHQLYDVLSISSFFVVLYTGLFQLIEGWFLFSSNAYACIIFSSCLGRIVSQRKLKR